MTLFLLANVLGSFHHQHTEPQPPKKFTQKLLTSNPLKDFPEDPMFSPPSTQPGISIDSTQIQKEAYPGYPECQDRINWLRANWNSTSTMKAKYSSEGVNGSISSFLTYLNQHGLYCPTLEDANRKPVRGVGIGGWLVLEPWLVPSLFEQFKPEDNVKDQWTFCKVLGPVECRRQLERHWDTFLSEDDVKTLAESGINTVRIPVGYWILGDVRPEMDEPWITGDLPYLQRAMLWFKRYNIAVMFDLHAAPGSQNGFDNSGHLGPLQWADPAVANDGHVFYPNIDRTMHVLEGLVSMFSLYPFYGVVKYIEVLNEPFVTIDINILKEFYVRATERIRAINPDVGIVIGDSFRFDEWNDFLYPPKYNHIYIDTHIYQVFDMGQLGMSWDQHLDYTCSVSLPTVAVAPLSTIVGEWSLATNDCAKWFNGIYKGARYDGSLPSFDGQTIKIGSCEGQNSINDTSVWTPEYKAFLRKFAETQMSAYEAGSSQGWVFWNFKTERAPQWNYLLGIKEGWIPKKLGVNDRQNFCK